MCVHVGNYFIDVYIFSKHSSSIMMSILLKFRIRPYRIDKAIKIAEYFCVLSISKSATLKTITRMVQEKTSTYHRILSLFILLTFVYHAHQILFRFITQKKNPMCGRKKNIEKSKPFFHRWSVLVLGVFRIFLICTCSLTVGQMEELVVFFFQSVNRQWLGLIFLCLKM